MLRLDADGLGEGRRSHVSLLAEVRSENGGRPAALRACTCASGRGRRARFDIQVGRVPPTFGAFRRRTYAADNPLIGYPLAYQYLTSLRADALPANADELLRMRGRGWLSNFSVGNLAPDRGRAARQRLPLGHRRPGPRRQRRRSTPPASLTADAVQPAGRATTTAAGRSPGASRCIRCPA